MEDNLPLVTADTIRFDLQGHVLLVNNIISLGRTLRIITLAYQETLKENGIKGAIAYKEDKEKIFKTSQFLFSSFIYSFDCLEDVNNLVAFPSIDSIVKFLEEHQHRINEDIDVIGKLWKDIDIGVEMVGDKYEHLGVLVIVKDWFDKRSEIITSQFPVIIEQLKNLLVKKTVANPKENKAVKYQFFKQGKIWTMTFNSETIPLQDSAGMKYIRLLLYEPGKKWSAFNLHGTANPAPPEVMKSGEFCADIKKTNLRGRKSTALSKGRRIYLFRRYSELKELIGDAETNNDIGAAEKYGKELFKISDTLAPFAKDDLIIKQESISKAIERSIKEIDKVHKQLANHLRVFIHTKGGFSYAPDDRGINWQITS
ncbi:MAG TPA: hypothetical protein VJC37_06170 [Planctomycetota bacterium]|nr:hypothetical protein [Planctomycetota bacterium]